MATLNVIFVPSHLNRILASSDICTFCIHQKKIIPANCVTQRVRTEKYSICTSNRMTLANRLHAKTVAKNLHESIIWIVICSTQAVIRLGKKRSCLVVCVERNLREPTIYESICVYISAHRHARRIINVPIVRNRFTDRRCWSMFFGLDINQ